jgi:hypothetical protein
MSAPFTESASSTPANLLRSCAERCLPFAPHPLTPRLLLTDRLAFFHLAHAVSVSDSTYSAQDAVTLVQGRDDSAVGRLSA